MKKRILLTLSLVFILLMGFSQKKSVTLAETKIGGISFEYSKSINLDSGDTIFMLFISFQNAKYQSITDLKYIYFTEQEDLIKFIADLEMAESEMGTKSTINWDREDYWIGIYDFSENLYLYDADESGHISIRNKNVVKIISWLKGINIGK